ncbi:MAG TPA: hypothetical protein VKS03_06270 [Thermoanaerobaculia bacterium]|nr:hypothetical protein [Thermoanaerobaculia bacterium]
MGSSKFFAAAVCFSLFAAALPAVESKSRGKSPALSLACADATGLSIAVSVCAGPGGAPGGFEIQWMASESFAEGPDGVIGTADDATWPTPADPDICAVSFVGREQFGERGIGPDECVAVDFGQLLADLGVPTNCPASLACGSSYVFRAITHRAAAPVALSVSPTVSCGTLACTPAIPGCVVTGAYWKDHGPLPRRGNLNEWNVASLRLGHVTYSDLELQAILETPADGNGLIALAHQLIAAKLNIASGTDDATIASTIAAADKVIGNLFVPPGGDGYLALSATWSLTRTLAAYNEGAVGPGHCD